MIDNASSTTTMHVRESETGLVRLFTIDMPAKEAVRLIETPGMIAAALGQSQIAGDQIDIFDLADLAGMGLATYLAEGHGIEDQDITAFRSQLNSLSGAVLLVRSAAITERPTELTPRAPLRWIATFGEDRPPVPMTGIETQSAKGQVGAAAPPATAQGSIGVLLLAILLTASIALAVWLVH